MDILFIGNSFAVDVATYIHEIAKSIGREINTYVLYIGGCPIKLHYQNYLSKEKMYDLFVNSATTYTPQVDIFKGLDLKQFDYVSFQQVSSSSGDPNSFFPELPLLLEKVRIHQPNATFLLHKTWSYAKYYSHSKYGQNPLDQDAMDVDINHAYLEVSNKVNIPYIVPSGEAIRLARKIYGDNLNRDGFHLNELGRTLCGVLWVMYLLKLDDIDLSNFYLSGKTYDEISPPIDRKEFNVIIKIVKETLRNNKNFIY